MCPGMSKHDLDTPQVTLAYPVEFEVANLNLAQIVTYASQQYCLNLSSN
jgi:hypothetical protein